ncbi:hypothetical protein LEMLEM_LOCUS13613 [Lemmus lemmus]
MKIQKTLANACLLSDDSSLCRGNSPNQPIHSSTGQLME